MSGIFPTPTVRTPFSASRSSTVPFGGGCEKSRRSYVRLNLPRPSPTKGRAMTRASPYSLPRVRAASHQEYSVCRGTFCSCAATWNTLSALVYTMGSPVRRCSSPSSSRITVPLAVLFPRYPGAPERRNHASIRAGGNPRGKVVKPFCSRTPIISQCPVVVSLPWDCSDMRPNAARGESVGGQPAMAVMFPRPHDWRFGTRRPPTLRAQFPSVFAPASPYAFASGSSPAPHESITMAMKRPISALRVADDGHAGARAQAIRAGLEHPPRIGSGAHASARLHAEVLADHLPHQGGARGDRLARLRHLGLGRLRSGGEADHRDGPDATPLEEAGAERHVVRGDADSCEPVGARLVAELHQVLGAHLGLQQRVVDVRSQIPVGADGDPIGHGDILLYHGGCVRAVLIALLCAGCCEFSGPRWHGRVTDHFDGERFHNQTPGDPALADLVRWRRHRAPGAWPDFADAPPAPAPPIRVTEGELRITFVNHATVLIQMDGLTVLTDPIWGDVAGPVPYIARK